MAAGMQLSLTGTEGVFTAFKILTEGMRRRVLKSAVTKSTQVFVPAIRKATPKSKPGSKSGKALAKNPSGTLKKSTGKIVRKYQGGSLVSGYAGHRWPKGAAAHLVFGGTADRFRKNMRRGYSGFVAANPAFRQAYLQNKSKAKETLREGLEIGLDKELSSIASKARAPSMSKWRGPRSR